MAGRDVETIEEMDARTRRRARTREAVTLVLLGVLWAVRAAWDVFGTNDVDWFTWIGAVGALVVIPIGLVRWRRHRDT